MKFLYIGSGILIVLLLVCILCNQVIVRCANDSVQTLSAALDAIDNGDSSEALALGKEANAIWNTHYKVLSCLLSHSELDQIESGFTALISYGYTETGGDFRYHCVNLISRLEHIKKMDFAYFYNFFFVPAFHIGPRA